MRSAGGVLFSEDQVVLISIGNERRWQLPKGRIERGESPAQAARREVREETGIDGIVLEPLTTIEFTYAQRSGRQVLKTIEYFLQRYDTGTVADFDPREVNEAVWFSWAEAARRLTFDNERQVLELAHGRWLERRRASSEGASLT